MLKEQVYLLGGAETETQADGSAAVRGAFQWFVTFPRRGFLNLGPQIRSELEKLLKISMLPTREVLQVVVIDARCGTTNRIDQTRSTIYD